MKRLPLLLFFLLVGCSGARNSTQNGSGQTLYVFAASSLTNAFSEIAAGFEGSHPGVTVTLNFAGSQILRTQILEGASADVVALASTQDMQQLEALGLVKEGSAQQVFASNHMVIILPQANPAGIKSPEDLGRPGIKLIIAAEAVPAGKYAREALNNLDAIYGKDFSARALSNVVSNEENVRQVVSKVQLGEADAGIVYISDTAAAPELKTLSLPEDASPPAHYPIAALTGSDHPELAQAFVAYVLSSEGQGRLRAWGFLSPPPQ
jgi:molybdate transport system substrate-binding protein